MSANIKKRLVSTQMDHIYCSKIDSTYDIRRVWRNQRGNQNP